MSKNPTDIEGLLGAFYDKLETTIKSFSRFIVKVSQVEQSFYVLIRKHRAKILEEN